MPFPSSALLPIALLCLAALPASAAPRVVQVKANPDGTFTLLRDNKPYFANGAGGSSQLKLLVECGGNTIRTWGIETFDLKVDGKPFLDRCEELGLGVVAGLWIEHARHGFDYHDAASIKKQRDKVRASIRKYKDHPAILMWGLGNEAEGPSGDGADPTIWKELNELAAIVKKEDPKHPILTVIAGVVDSKVANVIKYYPNIDILGVNAYAPAAGTGKVLKQAKWTKPFMLTEFGPMGHWEVRKTAWGAPVEPTSREKAAMYYATHQTVVEDGHGTCLGTFAFLWGHKQETTATWYGMHLASGERLPTVDAMTRAWTNKWPANRCPRVESIETPLREAEVKSGETITATATVRDPEGDAVSYQWSVIAESTDRKVGGDRESAPPTLPECIAQPAINPVSIKAPSKPGAYRLFLIVRDGKGGASAENIPFKVGT